jgi:hypothetical protein
MKISNLDFLALNSDGIDLFIQHVDAAVSQTHEPYEQAVRRLQKDLQAYIRDREAFRRLPPQTVIPAPLTMSLSELMGRKVCANPLYLAASRNVVYILRDGERVLYVGSSHYGARKRMKSHEKAHSPLGEALRTDPNRHNWSVEIITHADYGSAASKEKQLIAQFAPAFCRRF